MTAGRGPAPSKKIRKRAIINSGNALITSIVVRKIGMSQPSTSNPLVDPKERRTAPKDPMMVLKRAILTVKKRAGTKSDNSRKKPLDPLSKDF